MPDDAPRNSRFAAVDLGSHTIRLLIVDLEEGGTILPVAVDRRITRLASNFSEGETLKEESISASIAVLEEFATLIHRHKAQAVSCGATGVIRRARNAAEFLERVEAATGIPPSILSEEEEALLAAKGVLSGLPQKERFVLSFDLGGSSTELLLVDTSHGETLWSTSIFIGAATITEWRLRGDPPERPSIDRAVEAIREVMRPSLLQLGALLKDLNVPPSILQLVGTAGTVTTLAAMLLEMKVYEPSRINGLALKEAWLTQFIDILSVMPQAERLKLAGLENGRESIILGGALIVRELLRGLQQPSLTVVDSGLLEGLVLALVEKKSGQPSRLTSSFPFRLPEG
jgi:exopolyphosphatase / guanosine-5'-triphosphate,3'-diphosphate pyrophosphatase